MTNRLKWCSVTAVLPAAFCIPAAAVAGPWDVVRVVINPVSEIIERTTGQDTGPTVGDAVNALREPVAEARRTVAQATEAINAAKNYAVAIVRGHAAMLTDVQRDFRDGRIVGGLWRSVAEPYRINERASHRAMQESVVIRTAVERSVAVYGGPGGSAAFAAWYAYRESGGNTQEALRAGAIAGLQRAVADGSNLEANNGLARRAIVTGIVGGLAVAEAGGDEAAITEGFLRSGGMVLVEAGYDEAARRSGLDQPICLSAVNETCVLEAQAIQRDENGNIVWQDQEHGIPRADVRFTGAAREQVGTYEDAAQSQWRRVQQHADRPMEILSQAGRNLPRHDHWTISWNVPALSNRDIAFPGVILSYLGEADEGDDHFLDMALSQRRRHAAGRAGGTGVDAALLIEALRFSGGIDAAPRAENRRVQIWLDLPGDRQAQIRSVHYEFFGADFHNPKIGSPTDSFRARWLGYGCVQNARLTATLRNGSTIQVPFDFCDLWSNGIMDGV